MKRSWKRWWFSLAGLAVVAGLVLLAFCWWHRVWSVNEWRVYQQMERECHPVWRDFHFGHVRPGEPVDEVIARTEPMPVERAGRWVVLKYHGSGLHFTGLTAVPYDGQMVGAYAWSCTWTRQFFDTMSEDQQAEFFGGHYGQPAQTGNAILVR